MSHRVHLQSPERNGNPSRSVRLGQNFLVDRKLVSQLVGESTIGCTDVVYEIGPGRGALTEVLSLKAGKVIAVEKDPELYRALCGRLSGRPNVELHLGDFCRFQVPARHYRVFASIPFNMTALVVRTLLGRRHSPSDAWLVVQRESAEKFAGDGRSSLFSVLYGPWFAMRIVRDIPREAFSPVPAVAVVLLHIQRRVLPLVEDRNAVLYRRFAMYGFSGWKPNLKMAYRSIFSHAQWKRLSADLGFDACATCTQLTLAQWVGIFSWMLRGVPEQKWGPILGTFGGAGP